LAGAVAGGAIALLGQLITIRAANKQRREERRLTQEALGNALLFKMIRINSNFRSLGRLIEAQIEEAKTRGLDGELWPVIRPVVNVPENIDFRADEMGMLLGLTDQKVFNAVASIDAIHNSTMELITFFSEKRTELADRLAAEQVHGDHFSGIFSATEKLRLEPHISR
jgi:hypothetical protein